MTELLIFLAAGTVLLLLVAASSRRHSAEMEPEELAGPPDPSVMRRILAPQDMAYIASLRIPGIQRLFVRERRRLALAWLRASREEASRQLRRHAHMVRCQREIRPATEIRIAWLFGSSQLTCLIMAGFVWSCGPFRVPVLLKSVDYLLGSLESLGRTAGNPDLMESGASPT
jgi:hypothetical protein